MFDSLWPHGLQHARLLCLSPTPGAYSNSHVHQVGDAIQPSYPLSSPSPTAFNLSQNQGLFQCLHKKSTKHFLKFLVKCLRGMRSPVTISQFNSVAQSCPILCDPMNHSTSGLPVHHQLPQFTQTHVHRIGDAFSHLILCCPLLLLPPIPPSIRVYSNESTLCMRWPKYWFQLQHQSFQWTPRTDLL